ncbi:MAG: TonB-dependent receptor [Sphingomonas sp.]|jgi:iron complex outermembrane receptor protein
MTMKSMLLCGAFMPAMVLGAAAPAYAQATPANAQAPADEAVAEDDTGTIVVTGSRIRRDPLSQESPTVTVDAEAYARTGLSSIADVLQRLPGASGGLNSKVNNSGNLGNPPDGGGVGAGSAEIDLRYLGARRTLVLVDGLRHVNGTAGSGIPASVDLNTIPANSIERIEVLQSGASPLYGSDAVAGVVNIITKQKQKGLQASAQFGTFRQGDGHTQDYNISYGIQAPTTSIVFGASYVNQQSVRSGDRAISQFPNPGSTSCLGGGCSSATPLGRFIVNDFGNPANTDGLDLTLRGPVSGRPNFTPGNPTGPGSDFKDFATLDRFNFAPFNYILTPSERYGFFVNAKQELSSHVNFRAKFVYSHRNSQNQAAFLPLFVGPDAGNGNLLDTISIDATNPFNPFGVTLSAGGAGNPPANYSFIARRLVEAGQRTFNQRVDTWSLTGTLDGDFNVGNRTWYWDVNAVLGLNDAHQLFTGNVNAAKLAQALGPIANCTGECVPFNIFGGVGSITPAQLAFVGFDERDRSSQLLNDYTANLSGDLFDLPAGSVGFALGYEHRFQRGSFDPDPVIAAGLGADIPAQPARGQFSVNEFYGELKIPLLSNTPFFQLLDVDGAVRYSDYSTFGGNTTYTGSVNWKPVGDLLLRGSYARNVRAPGIGELFGSRSRFDQPTTDPCSNTPGSAFATSATVRTNCIANGVPANGSYAEPPGQVPVITGGNPALQPETSRTLVFGGVYSPDWVRKSGFARAFSIEANYYNIRLNGAISSIGADVLLNRCALSGDALSCAAINRSSNGFLAQINAQLLNVGTVETDGVDVTLNYRSPQTGIGSFGISSNNSFLLKYNESVPATAGFTLIERVGTERGSPDQAYPRFKSNTTFDWAIASVGVSFTGRYISGVTESQNNLALGSRFYGDIQLTYTPSWVGQRVTLTAGVNNVFNQDPPACVSCSLNNFDPTTYDVPGQFGYLRLSYKL